MGGLDDLQRQMNELVSPSSLRARGGPLGVIWLSVSGVLGIVLFAALGVYAVVTRMPRLWLAVVVSVGGVLVTAYWLWRLSR